MKTILVGYDQTDQSERALERALELGKAFEAKILVTSVARVMADAGTGRSMGGLDPTDSPEEHAAELHMTLSSAAGEAEGEPFSDPAATSAPPP